MTDHSWETTAHTDSYVKEWCPVCGAKRKKSANTGGVWHFISGGETCFSEELSPAAVELRNTGTE